jgi:hypothetical protein
MAGTAPVAFALLIEPFRVLVEPYVEALFAEGIQPIVVPIASGARNVARLRGEPRLIVYGLKTARSDEFDGLLALRGTAPVLAAPAIVFSADPLLLDLAWSLREPLGIVATLRQGAARDAVAAAVRDVLHAPHDARTADVG